MIDRNRAIVLERVRKSLGVTRGDAVREKAVADRLGRHPRGTVPARARGNRKSLLALLKTMLAGQGADVIFAGTPEAAVTAVLDTLRAHNLPAILRIGADPLLASLPWHAVASLEVHHGRAEPDDRAALSRAVAAAAETGTLFLASGADNPTTLAFLPEQHAILVRVEDVVGAYEEAFDRLREIHGQGLLPRSVNMISGPSRTADIEQTIVRGAHGPKRLLVVILG